MSVALNRLTSTQSNFDASLQGLLERSEVLTTSPEVSETVTQIINAVRTDGDKALMRLTEKFDQWSPSTAEAFEIPKKQWKEAAATLPKSLHKALQQAATRVRDYHQRQKLTPWSYEDEYGNLIGQRVTPLARVGIYVPGGTATYPSTVIMNAVPAQIAGVEDIIMVMPCPKGEVNKTVLAAAEMSGVGRIFRIGGAQAIAALAYGTETIPKVDKIVGPGNRYVSAAKKQIWGTVGTDMLAGPSEVLIVTDGSMDAKWVALDCMSQAEHDEQSQVIVISPKSQVLNDVSAAIQELLPRLQRRKIISAALKRWGLLIETTDMAEALTLVNRIAPEHLVLGVRDPDSLLPQVQHAGSIFLGCWGSEVMGDYCAGPNHVLPTCGTARYRSPLGVTDFQKYSSVLKCSPTGAAHLAKIAAPLAASEGLTAHELAALCRIS